MTAWPAIGLALFFPLIAAVTPKMMVGAFLVAGIAAIALHPPRFDQIDCRAVVPVALLFLWAGISLLWTANLHDAGSKFLRFTPVFVIGLLALPSLTRAEAKGPMLAGMAIALGYLLLEYATNNTLTRFLHGVSAEVALASGSDFTGWRLNRGITTLAFAIWGALLVLRRRWLMVVLPLSLTAFFMLFESLSGVVGLGAGCVAAAAALIHRRLGRLAAVVAIAIALFGVPAMVLSGLIDSSRALVTTDVASASSAVKHTTSSVAKPISDFAWALDSERVKIWHFVTDRAVENPVIGSGFRASRAMSDSLHNGHRISMSHPHNVALEIALELGAVGLLLVAAFLLSLECRVAELDDDSRVTATGLLVTVLAVSTTAYSIWQAHAFLPMVFGYMVWKIGHCSYLAAEVPVASDARR